MVSLPPEWPGRHRPYALGDSTSCPGGTRAAGKRRGGGRLTRGSRGGRRLAGHWCGERETVWSGCPEAPLTVAPERGAELHLTADAPLRLVQESDPVSRTSSTSSECRLYQLVSQHQDRHRHAAQSLKLPCQALHFLPLVAGGLTTWQSPPAHVRAPMT